MKTIVLFAALCVTLAGSALAEDQHRRPDNIKQYLEHLDSTERDRYQKPSEVIEALRLKPGMAVADLGFGSGYFTRRFIEAVTETGMVYAVDVEPEMLAYAKESVIHMHTAYTAESSLRSRIIPSCPSISSSSATPSITLRTGQNTSATSSRPSSQECASASSTSIPTNDPATSDSRNTTSSRETLSSRKWPQPDTSFRASTASCRNNTSWNSWQK